MLSLCFNTYSKHKFNPKTRGHVFLGFPYGMKGYNLSSIEDERVFMSKNVIFYAHIMPYKKMFGKKDYENFNCLA